MKESGCPSRGTVSLLMNDNPIVRERERERERPREGKREKEREAERVYTSGPSSWLRYIQWAAREENLSIRYMSGEEFIRLEAEL